MTVAACPSSPDIHLVRLTMDPSKSNLVIHPKDAEEQSMRLDEISEVSADSSEQAPKFSWFRNMWSSMSFMKKENSSKNWAEAEGRSAVVPQQNIVVSRLSTLGIPLAGAALHSTHPKASSTEKSCLPDARYCQSLPVFAVGLSLPESTMKPTIALCATPQCNQVVACSGGCSLRLQHSSHM